MLGRMRYCLTGVTTGILSQRTLETLEDLKLLTIRKSKWNVLELNCNCRKRVLRKLDEFFEVMEIPESQT